MKSGSLVLRSITYYWRTNAAVVLGVATAVAVLAGALLVGDSVRGSLRDLVLQRLGKTDKIVVSTGFLREQFAHELRSAQAFNAFDAICPILMAQGFVTQQPGPGRAGRVLVYGVDDRFWQFHGVGTVSGPSGTDAMISSALARDLDAQAGTTILVRIQQPSSVPLESLHSAKDSLGRTLRANVKSVLPREALGEFALQAQQGEIRAVFLPLTRLQEVLGVDGRVNVLLFSVKSASVDDATGVLEQLIRTEAKLEDVGLKLRVLDAPHVIALEADGGLLNDAKAKVALEVAEEVGLRPQPVFTYLANSLRSGKRETPYSLVTAMDLPRTGAAVQSSSVSTPPSIILTDWAARDLRATPGALVTMEYYIWEEPGRLATRTLDFRVSTVVPLGAGDRDLAPDYPGITASPTLEDWNPPFPIDLRRVRRVDEEYWNTYRTTPKAFIPFAVGQQLWQSRYASATSIRFVPTSNQSVETLHAEYAKRLRAKLDPLAMGLAVQDVRNESLEASRGATDFGTYFIYFSFFLVASALLLAALFFKLSVEQRVRELGLLRAVGFRTRDVARLFIGEALLLSFVGATVGLLGGLGYGYLIVMGLRTWWIGAVGTTALTLHISFAALAGGALAGIVAAMACVWVTLRGLARISERSLLAGQLAVDTVQADHGRLKGRFPLIAAIACAGLGGTLLLAAAAHLIAGTGAFFGAGAVLLAACLSLFVFWFGLPVRKPLDHSGWWPLSRLGLRNAMYRPTRSVLAIAMIASATFILISVDAFRRDVGGGATSPHSGVGGYSLIVESLLPVIHDPNSREGRETLGLSDDASVAIDPFRVHMGDDASCLNLYQPKNPRILAPTDSFISAGRFAFQDSLASNAQERANPWLLLHRDEPDGAIPVIADANSMKYVLKRKLGDEFVMERGEAPIRLRLVAALDDSIFQQELLMSQAQFQRVFPEDEGYKVLLIETAPDRLSVVLDAVETSLTDLGAEATSTTERLAAFHQVENTYLSTFQMLGGLGLLLGTVGLGAVLLRNVLERRRELALLRALGYRRAQFFAMAVAENALLLMCGLCTGAVCALLAISPVLLERAGHLPAIALVVLLGSVLAAGLATSVVATAAALRSPLLATLREE